MVTSCKQGTWNVIIAKNNTSYDITAASFSFYVKVRKWNLLFLVIASFFKDPSLFLGIPLWISLKNHKVSSNCQIVSFCPPVSYQKLWC